MADAIVINGTAYVPIRAVSDAAGIELTVEGKRILIQEELVDGLSVSDQIKATKILEIKMNIEKWTNQIEKTQSDLSAEKAKLNRAATAGERESITSTIKKLTAELEIMNNLVTRAKADLAKLQNN